MYNVESATVSSSEDVMCLVQTDLTLKIYNLCNFLSENVITAFQTVHTIVSHHNLSQLNNFQPISACLWKKIAFFLFCSFEPKIKTSVDRWKKSVVDSSMFQSPLWFRLNQNATRWRCGGAGYRSATTSSPYAWPSDVRATSWWGCERTTTGSVEPAGCEEDETRHRVLSLELGKT